MSDSTGIGVNALGSLGQRSTVVSTHTQKLVTSGDWGNFRYKKREFSIQDIIIYNWRVLQAYCQAYVLKTPGGRHDPNCTIQQACTPVHGPRYYGIWC